VGKGNPCVPKYLIHIEKENNYALHSRKWN